MPLKVLIAPDKFKGTLTAAAAARAIARGWSRVRPEDRLETVPMSDGGDGFGAVLGDLLHARLQTVKTVDAAHRPCRASWWWEAKSKTAIVESAKVIGLAMLPPGKFHPFKLDTFGLGKVLQTAHANGARRIIIGIGGSATNDGGFGMARALGWKFSDKNGKSIERWTDLGKLADVQPPTRRKFSKVIVAVDVQNPLLGKRGATRIFGSQKGIRAGDFLSAERCLQQLARAMKRRSKTDFARLPGAGAAGGLGFGVLAFLNAHAESGFDLFANHTELDRKLRSADLVITGEGALDSSTLMGKGVGQLARCCRARKIPCVGLGGVAVRSLGTKKYFNGIHSLTDLTTLAQAKAKPALWLERLAGRAAKACDMKCDTDTLLA